MSTLRKKRDPLSFKFGHEPRAWLDPFLLDLLDAHKLWPPILTVEVGELDGDEVLICSLHLRRERKD